jgi:cell wall-associated NlpC family hydrolase
MTGRHGTARPVRHGRTLVASAAGAVGLGLLVFSLSDVSIADASETTSPESPDSHASPATSDATPHDRGAAQVPSAQVAGAQVVRAAAGEHGEPYKYGANGPESFDCSGLTQHVYAQFGVELPHNSAAQYRAVDHVAKAEMRRGDLVFFHNQDGIYHVGIYAGDKQVWAAQNPGEDVRKHPIWTDRFVVGRP